MAEKKYVKDYRLHETFEANGRIRTRTEYIGENYDFEQDPEQVKRAFRAGIQTCAAAWVSFAAFLLPPTRLMHRAAVAFPLIISALPLFLATHLLVTMRHAQPPLERRIAERLGSRYPVYALSVCVLSFAAVFSAVILLIRGIGQALYGVSDGLVLAGAIWLFLCGVRLFRRRGQLRCAPERETESGAQI